MGVKITTQGKLIVAAFAVFYILLRFWRLTDSCLWFDEIFSVHAADHSWSEIIPFVAKDLIHPPLFYLLLKVWIFVGGESLFWLRLFPVILSILAVLPLWMLCRELKLRPDAIILSFGLFAVNGALIKYAQEVRMYSVLLFLSMMSVWLFSRYYFRGKSFWMLVIVNILLVYTHYFGWLIVGTELLVILVAQRIKIARTLLMFLLTAAAFVPWLVAIFKFAEPGSSLGQNIGWMQRPGVRAIIDLVFDLFDPFYFQQSNADKSANFVIVLPLILILVVGLVVYLISFQKAENKDRIFFLLAFLILPSVIAFVLSWTLPVSVWGSRHLLIVFVPAMVLFAVFLGEVRPILLRNFFFAAVAVLSVAAFVIRSQTVSPAYSWCAWSEVASEFMRRRDIESNENLYVFEDLAAYHLWFSLRHREDITVSVVTGTGVPEDAAYFLPRGFTKVRRIGLEDIHDSRLWIGYRLSEVISTEPPLRNFLVKGYHVSDQRIVQTEGEKVIFLALEK